MNQFRISTLVARIAMLLALVAFAVPFATAQVTTGALQGTVLDPNGAAVAGATIKVTNVDTGISRDTTTNTEGFYRVTNLTPGANYRVEVTATGFTARPVEGIMVRAATENTADVKVGLQNVGETVNVQATDQALIQSEQTSLTTSYTPQQLTQLPYVGAIDNLALLTPGVVTPGDADFTNGVGISANGNRGRSNNFQIDGQDNNDNSVAGPALTLTNAEAIGDYQVITNTFSAEFGRNSGAQINVVTKSGTNQFHGSLFEFHRNSALNARDNQEKLAGSRFGFIASNGFPQFGGLANRFQNGPAPFRENRFGGALGGPLKQNKAFFFVTYEGTIFRGEDTSEGLGGGSFAPNAEGAANLNRIFGTNATSSLASIGPANAANAGSFLCAPPTTDTNGDGIPDEFNFSGNGNLAPLAIVADPTAPGGRRTIFGCEPVRVTPSQQTSHQIISRVDWNLTAKDSIVARYIFDHSEFPGLAGRALGGFFFDEPTRNNNLGVTYTRTLSSHSVNEARFTFSRLNVQFGDVSVNPGPGIAFAGTRSLAGGLLTAFGPPNNLPQSRVVDTYQAQDTFSTTIGNHAAKFGMDIRHQKVDNFFLPNFSGQYRFNSGGAIPANTFFNLNGCDRQFARNSSCQLINPNTGAVLAPGATPFPNAATAFENFTLGRFDQVTFALGNPRIITSQNDFFFFGQDDWRVRPNLTLNMGLRYEVSTTPFNPIIDQINAREADPARAIFNQAFPLSTRTANQLPIDKNNIGPSVGFAWQPNFKFLGDRFTNGRTVVRGAFRVAYDPPYFNIVLNTVTAAPFAAAGTVRQTPGGTGAQTFPFLPSTTAQLNLTPGTNGGDPRLFNQTRVDPDFHQPYTMSYNFGIQQELWKNSVLEVRYVGSRIVGQFQTINGNPDLRFLLRAGQTLRGNPTAFTHGILPGTCSEATCVTPTVAGLFNTRTADATGSRITGSGRVDPFSGPTRTRINGASSTYNGMQVRFDTRFTNNFVMNTNYTFSRTIDNASEIFSTFGGGQTVAQSQDPFDFGRGERGLSAFHQKHNFTTNFIYSLPWFKEQRGFAGKLLGGYEVGAIIRGGSGRPYTPTNLFATYDPTWENAFVGSGALRPFNGNPNAPVGTIAVGVTSACAILFGDAPCNAPNAVPGNFIIYDTRNVGSVGRVVTPAEALQQARLFYNDFGTFSQFGIPLTGCNAETGDLCTEAVSLFGTPFGNVGRNTFIGEPFALVNASIFKTTRISENVKIEFRAEAFNLLNHRNFGVPDPFTEDASNGFTVSSFQNPGYNNGGNRTMRFGLRLLF
ncbi:MAG TPA: carboxypeptidase regulatory-like domain-containing protein [Pyrinomonadaceae bacterium]|jgi:hypothetical protein